MIQKECFDKEWIDKVCSTHKFRHPALVEKVIRAFSLLEMLVKEGCPLTFKGGHQPASDTRRNGPQAFN